jgi:hypothetical protein
MPSCKHRAVRHATVNTDIRVDKAGNGILLIETFLQENAVDATEHKKKRGKNGSPAY